MPHHRSHLSLAHRLPRARVDPIVDAADALSILSMAMNVPIRHEVVGCLLDDENHGGVLTVVSGTDQHDSVITIVETLCMSAASVPEICGLVVASVRPDSGTVPGDIDRWLDASSIAEMHGIELIEWFIVCPAGVECPRDLLGEPERW